MLPLWSSAQSLNKGSLHFDSKLQRNHSVTKPSYASQLCIAQPKHIQKQKLRGGWEAKYEMYWNHSWEVAQNV